MRNTKFRSLMQALLVLALASPVWAAGGEGESNIFAGDIGNVLWTLLTFGLVLVVLGKFVWGPLVEMIQKREAFIRESLETAKRDREAAEARLKEFEERLAEARAEASALVEEGRRDAEATKKRIVEEAQEAAAKERERSLRDISIARETAVKDLYELSGKMATEIAGRIVAKELDPEAHQALIAQAISEISSSVEEAN